VPANLTPQYYEAEQAFKNAKTKEEKLAALEEMLAVIPKHKGTDKLRGDLRKRLSKLREQEDKKTGARYDPFVVDREGAGQVALFGCPNAGKSALVSRLTNAKVTVAEYPFSTQLPSPGMMPYEDILIQLVDTPPVTGDMFQPEMIGTIRNADMVLIVVDAASDDCLTDLEACIDHLYDRRILRDEHIEGVRGFTPGECILVANKLDKAGASEHVELLRALKPDDLELVEISVETGEGLENLRRRIFEKLELVRVYSKVPGEDPDMEAPFVMKRGSTVLEFAEQVHKEIARNLKTARIWGSAKYDGASVPRDHVLEDGDIVELRADR